MLSNDAGSEPFASHSVRSTSLPALTLGGGRGRRRRRLPCLRRPAQGAGPRPLGFAPHPTPRAAWGPQPCRHSLRLGRGQGRSGGRAWRRYSAAGEPWTGAPAHTRGCGQPACGGCADLPTASTDALRLPHGRWAAPPASRVPPGLDISPNSGAEHPPPRLPGGSRRPGWMGCRPSPSW